MPRPLPPPSELQRIRYAIDKLREIEDLLGDQESVERFHVQPGSRQRTLSVIGKQANVALTEVEKLAAPAGAASPTERSPSLRALRRGLAECGERYDALEKEWPSSATLATAELKLALESLLSAIKTMQEQPK